jgi:hypothetical protein
MARQFITGRDVFSLAAVCGAVYAFVTWGLPWIKGLTNKDAAQVAPVLPGSPDDSQCAYTPLLAAEDNQGTSFALIQQGLADGLGAAGMGALLSNQTAYMQAYMQQIQFGALVAPTPSGGSGGLNRVSSPQRAF